MARFPQNRGIGRGNGSGSKATQFNADNWTGNGNGRPKKSSDKAVDVSMMAKAVKRIYSKKIRVNMGSGVSKTMSQRDALIELMVSRFADYNPKEQIAVLSYLDGWASHKEADEPYQGPSEQRIHDFIEGLAKMQSDRTDAWENERTGH